MKSTDTYMVPYETFREFEPKQRTHRYQAQRR